MSLDNRPEIQGRRDFLRQLAFVPAAPVIARIADSLNIDSNRSTTTLEQTVSISNCNEQFGLTFAATQDTPPIGQDRVELPEAGGSLVASRFRIRLYDRIYEINGQEVSYKPGDGSYFFNNATGRDPKPYTIIKGLENIGGIDFKDPDDVPGNPQPAEVRQMAAAARAMVDMKERILRDGKTSIPKGVLVEVRFNQTTGKFTETRYPNYESALQAMNDNKLLACNVPGRNLIYNPFSSLRARS